MTDPTNDYRVKPPPPCAGCGGQDHGSINKERKCLIDNLELARAEIVQLKKANPLTESIIERNRAQSRHFDDTRGRNKP